MLRPVSRVWIPWVLAVIGALMPLRPFLKVADPIIETVDMVLCPAYVLLAVVPPLSERGLEGLFAVAIASNSLLYYRVAALVLFVVRKRNPDARAPRDME